MILYPTQALGTAGIQDEELRRGLCSGFNAFFADLYGPYSDRLAPAVREERIREECENPTR